MGDNQQNTSSNKTGLFIMLIVLVLVIAGAAYLYFTKKGNDNSNVLGQQQQNTPATSSASVVASSTDQTFYYNNTYPMCTQDGKPVVYLFSTTWCPHCQWVKETFDETVKEYIDQGKIVAYHYELDIKDDTLTSSKETSVPQEALDVFKKFNSRQSIPTYVLGCQYWRVGNGFEAQSDLNAEEQELRRVIEKLISSK